MQINKKWNKTSRGVQQLGASNGDDTSLAAIPRVVHDSSGREVARARGVPSFSSGELGR